MFKLGFAAVGLWPHLVAVSSYGKIMTFYFLTG